jgi:hypothetical protein
VADPKKTTHRAVESFAFYVPRFAQAITYGPALGAEFGLSDSVISSIFGDE